MFEASGSGNLWAGTWDSGDGDTVVFFVVAQEGKFLVHKGDVGAQEILVEGDHFLVVPGTEDDMGEGAWALDFEFLIKCHVNDEYL